MAGGAFTVPRSRSNLISFQSIRAFGCAPRSSSSFASTRLSSSPVVTRGGAAPYPWGAHPGERVKRRPAWIGCVGIGAAGQQHRGGLVVGVDDCESQRARTVGCGGVGIRVRREQRLDGGHVISARRKEQRRPAALGHRVDARTSPEELLDHRRVALSGRPHQRRLPTPPFLVVDWRATLQQHLDHGKGA